MSMVKDKITELAELWETLVKHDRTGVPRHCMDWKGNVSIPFEDIMDAVLNGAPMDHSDRIEITLADCSEYGGSCLDRANVRVLRDDFGCEAIEDWGPHGESRAWVVLGEVPGADEDDIQDQIDRLQAIVDAMDGLDDYPLIRDESHSELEMQLADEAWDAWLWLDIKRGVETIFEERWGDDWQNTPDPDDFEDKIREAYYSHDETWWTCESANSAVNENHEGVLADVLDQVLGQVYPAHV
jgi:hypothetical protein